MAESETRVRRPPTIPGNAPTRRNRNGSTGVGFQGGSFEGRKFVGPQVRFRVQNVRISNRMSPGQKATTSQTIAALDGMAAAINQILKIIEEATPDAVYSALADIEFDSMRLCPVDTGTLRDSHFIEVSQNTGGSVVGEVGVAKGGVPNYAIWVHEIVERQHEPPTQAKFLQTAIQINSAKIPQTIIDFMKVE